MGYEATHAAALAKLRAKGAPVQFVAKNDGEYDPTTDTETPAGPDTVVDGYAAEIPAEPEEYALPELIGTEPKVLFFVPTVFGTRVPKNAQVVWAGDTRTVRHQIPIQPDGVLVASRVFVV